MRRIALVFLLAGLLMLAAGCGSKKHNTVSSAPPSILPLAKTPDEWASRIVELVLRPLNKDLQVVNGFNTPQVILYIANRNQTTLNIIKRRLNDLALCSKKLIAIGPPPPGRPQLDPVNRELTSACSSYVQIAQTLKKATFFISSGRQDVIAEGRQLLVKMKPDSHAAATHFSAFLRAAQKLPEFRRAGLQPSA